MTFDIKGRPVVSDDEILMHSGQRRKYVWRKYRFGPPDQSRVSCVYCLHRMSFSKMTVEHIIPVSMGGTHHPTNLLPACGPCNSRRGNGPPLL